MKGETKKDRFTRIAERRVQRVIDSLKSLSQCSNKRMYQWDDAQLKKMWAAIDGSIKKCKEGFGTSEPEEFRL